MKNKMGYAIIGMAIGIIIGGIIIASSASSAIDRAEPATQAEEDAPMKPKTESKPLLFTTAVIVESEPIIEWHKPDQEDIEMLAKLLWGEARGVKSKTEKAAVVWCVLNRVDAKGYPDTIAEVITQPHQFVGYNEDYPATTEHMEIAEDVLNRWYAEKVCTFDAGRVLPREYIFFTGDGKQNHFTDEWKGGTTWDWSLPSPYEKRTHTNIQIRKGECT